MSVRKLVLVPEALWQRCSNVTNNKQSTMANIKRPVENALYESVSEMNNAVVDPMLSDSEKVDKHVAALNDLSVLKERMKAKPVQLSTQDFSPILSELPTTLQRAAQSLLSRLQQNAIGWNEKGELKVDDQTWSGSNITDLLSAVLRNRKKFSPAYRDQFLKTLAAFNTPDEFVKNKNLISRYRQMKLAPPGIQLQSNSNYNDDTDDEENEINLQTFSNTPKLKKPLKRISKVRKKATPKTKLLSIYK